MVKLEPAGFPSKYLDCYESALMGILKHMGLANETPLMGTQAYFVLEEDRLSVYPRFHFISEEWERIHGLAVKTLFVDDEADLRDEIVDRLGSGMPVCLTTDIYFLPHTSHHECLHQIHFIDVFGYDDGRYYMVCPYYRFTGWMDADVVHTGFFSPALGRRYLMFVPELKCEALSADRVQSLVQESCQNMLGLTVPEVLIDVDSQCLGLSGIRTFSDFLHRLMSKQNKDLRRREVLLHLSREIVSVGNSRYWFHRLIQTCQQDLLSGDMVADLEGRFADVVRSWRAVGLMLGAGAHANRPEKVEQAILQLERMYEQEYRLFNSLLGALPSYEEGRL